MKEQVKLQIGGRLENLSMVSNFIDNSMTKFGLGDYEIFQIQTAVDEAVKNIIKHGYLDRSRIQIKFEKMDNEIQIIIEYGGKSFNPTSMEELELNSELIKDKSDSISTYFVKKNMNRIEHEFKDDLNILTLIKRL